MAPCRHPLIPLVRKSPPSFTSHDPFLRLLTEINASRRLYCAHGQLDEEAIVWEKKANNRLHFFSFLYTTPASALVRRCCTHLRGIAYLVWFTSFINSSLI